MGLGGWGQQFPVQSRTTVQQTKRLVCSLLFKVTQKVFSFPSMSIFTSVGNDFVQIQENVQTEEGSSVPSIWLDLLQHDWLYAASGQRRTAASRMTMANQQWLLPSNEGRWWVLPSRVCLELYSMCERMGCLARNTIWHVRFTLWPHRIANLLQNCELAGLISKARAGQTACCLSSNRLELFETEQYVGPT